MKKQILPLFIFALFNTSSFAGSATILKVSKTINEKNVLHYKVRYDDATCEIKGDVYADWKMDEEDGQWKSLDESPGFIRGPLEPKSTAVSSSEVIFVTESMDEFSKKGILDSRQVTVSVDRNKSGACQVRNEVLVRGELYNLKRLHSKVTMFGNVRWVEFHGEDSSGRPVKMRLK
jgi:hypothetical protein